MSPNDEHDIISAASREVNIIKLFNKQKKSIQTGNNSLSGAERRSSGLSSDIFEENDIFLADKFYGTLRRQVPVIDAAIAKIVRLTGGFSVLSSDERYQSSLDDFVRNVPVGLTSASLPSFIDSYLDSLLTYGNAAGEIVFDSEELCIAGLCNADPHMIRIEEKSSDEPFEKRIFFRCGNETREIPHPERILFSALNPPCGKKYGVSVLQGLPVIGRILMRIYQCIGQNYDRIGNVRYAVTYKPSDDPEDRAYAAERTKLIAKEWNEGMKSAPAGEVRDFIAAGNVDIKVIGAENPLIDTEIPVRQLLEQITAKLGIPPFLLGFSWSSTERMSQQQCDILTSELEYYRRQLTPIIERICRSHLRISGISAGVCVQWDNINLQDEVELARAKLLNAQAEQLSAEAASRR